MRHEIYSAMEGRLAYLRDMADKIEGVNIGGAARRAFMVGGAEELVGAFRAEVTAIEEALVGDDPLVLASIEWLAERYKDSDLVLRQRGGWPSTDVRINYGGNEHWVFADVQIGDDYGVFDFEVKYAIWRNTGALYKVRYGGDVADDPIFVPEGSSYTGPTEPTGEVAP